MCKCESFEGRNYSKLKHFYRQTSSIEICIFIDGGNWFIETSVEDKPLSTLQIYYCPLCGRKLD